MFKYKMQTIRRSSFNKNIVANLVGRVWSAAISIVCIPIFLRILGPEAFGLAGLFVSLQMIFTFLDFGLSATANRQIARNTSLGSPAADNRNMLRTFELVYWATGIIIVSAVLSSAGWISNNWLNVRQLSHSDVSLAIIIIAMSIAARWPISLYTGVLQGLQYQVVQNVITIIAVSLRTLGAVLVLIFISPTITAYLSVQAVINILEVLITKRIAWNLLGHTTETAHFQLDWIKRIWQFAVSFNFISILVMLVGQADRVVISKILPLEDLGFYSVACTPAGSVSLVGLAVVTAAFPCFAAHSAKGDFTSKAQHYHSVVQMVAFPAIAAALALVFFSHDILLLWTGSPETALRTAATLSILAAGYLGYALETPAYNFLIASGLTKLPIMVNALSIAVFIPAMIVTLPRWGIKAAALAWLLQKTIAFFAYSIFVTRTLLKEKYLSTVVRDVFYYLLVGVAWIGAGNILVRADAGSVTRCFALLLAEIGFFCSVLALSTKLRVFPSAIVDKIFPPKVSLTAIR